ncbi:MAG: hypothetical protein ACOZJX_19380 [Pseudomonadota bacterium]
MHDDDPQVQSLVRELEACLEAHPFACDSADGIARWWLRSAVDPHALESALRVLQLRGLVDQVTGVDGRVRYQGRGHHPRHGGDA